jgi:hypothetical protein
MGGVASTTVTLAVQLAVKLAASVTVKTTSFTPTLAQLKADLSIFKLATEQLSDDPLLT